MSSFVSKQVAFPIDVRGHKLNERKEKKTTTTSTAAAAATKTNQESHARLNSNIGAPPTGIICIIEANSLAVLLALFMSRFASSRLGSTFEFVWAGPQPTKTTGAKSFACRLSFLLAVHY